MEIRKDYRQYFFERVQYVDETAYDVEQLLQVLYQNHDEIKKEEEKKGKFFKISKRAFLDTAILLSGRISLEDIASLKPYEFFELVQINDLEEKWKKYFEMANTDDNWYLP